ncbi:COBW domain-containing protein 2 [Morella rubra]|uniref:COBW domain-containing protein 2 n=1 Tax=Morella rubra TaxID=262757 RepID=A0A6A1W7I4_9ROSI|nr:COBW domain-containing protein 2 [Morella rubra]
MASITADLATTFLTLTARHRTPLSRVQATVLPFLLSPATPQSRSLRFTTSSFHSRIIAVDFSKPKGCSRRLTVAASASATTTPQSEGSDVSTKIPPDNRVPATIITGFLGSGKGIVKIGNELSPDQMSSPLKEVMEDTTMGSLEHTTLLNHILTAEHGKRIAVIENEFGEVDIDGSLVAAKTTGAEDIVMLNNGCLCCTVRGDLVRMISELVNKKKGKFDHIVIETTGLANPAPIIQTFYAEDQVFNDVKLDGVVTLVDAKHAGFHLDEVKPKGVVNEAIEQIAYADRIIVNKTDLVGESETASLIQRIRKINRMANLKRTEFGKVDLDYVLGIGGFDLERIESVVSAEGAKEDHDHEHNHNHDHEHHDHHHDDHSHDHEHEHHDGHHSHDHSHDPGVSSANIWLGTLLLERSEDIYRMKGLLSVQGMDERFVFQGVHDIFQGSPDRMWGPDEPRMNKIVFIGKNLDAQELDEGFKSCLL